jgi:hypothetical protein
MDQILRRNVISMERFFTAKAQARGIEPLFTLGRGRCALFLSRTGGVSGSADTSGRFYL